MFFWLPAVARLLTERNIRRIVYIEDDTRLTATPAAILAAAIRPIAWLGYEPRKRITEASGTSWLHGSSLIVFTSDGLMLLYQILLNLVAARPDSHLMHFDNFIKSHACMHKELTDFSVVAKQTMTNYTRHTSATQRKMRDGFGPYSRTKTSDA